MDYRDEEWVMKRIAELEATLAACADQAGDESYAAVCKERDEARAEVERLRGLRGLLVEWVGQHASAEDLLEDTKAALKAGERE